MLHLVELLSQDSRLTASEMAARLGVSTRTLHRDIAVLRESGYRVSLAPANDDANRKSLSKIQLPTNDRDREALQQLLQAIESGPRTVRDGDLVGALKRAIASLPRNEDDNS
ncbi:MAG: HTH domain-containing protein [Planctomycetota bacterium]